MIKCIFHSEDGSKKTYVAAFETAEAASEFEEWLNTGGFRRFSMDIIEEYQRPTIDDRGGSPDNSFHCANCKSLFDMGESYPSDTFCSSDCYFHYHYPEDCDDEV